MNRVSVWSTIFELREKICFYMNTNKEYRRPARFLSVVMLLWVALLTVCATSCNDAMPTVDEGLEDASVFIADGKWREAQITCEHLFTLVVGGDSTQIDENQAAQLSILFMRLSERQREADNVADAIQCLRYAFSLSTDSLNAFYASLPLEDERHFVLLRRIGLSIDNPVDLSGKDAADGQYDADSVGYGSELSSAVSDESPNS